MTTREMEARVRTLARRSPPAALRARVIDAAMSAAEAPPVSQIHPMPIDTHAARRPVWRTAAVVTLAVTFFVIAGCAGLDVWAQHQLDLEIARFEAKHGSLTAATIMPPVPDADNRALVVRAAAELAVPIAAEHYYTPYPTPSPLPIELRAFASANRAAISRLGDLWTRKQADWKVVYQNPIEIDYPTLMAPWESVRILSQAISSTARVEIEDGRPEDAGRAIASALGIAASMRQESNVALSNIRRGLLEDQFRLTRSLIGELEPSAAILKDIAWWFAENRVNSEPVSLVSRMKAIDAIFARMEQGDIDPAIVESLYPITWPRGPQAFMRPAAAIGRPFVRLARLRSLRKVEQALDSVEGPRPRPAVEPSSPPQPWEFIDRLVFHFVGQPEYFGVSEDNFSSQFAIAELGVALRRFKMERSEYPNDLAALVPNYLDVLPIDPYTGQPPIYARRDSGFTLYGRADSSYPDIRKYLALDWDVKR